MLSGTRLARVKPVDCSREEMILAKFLMLVAALAALGGAARAAAGPEVTDFTLPNGLEVVVVPDHRAPVVTHMIWYKVGAADETPGKSGLAHFLEHLMFKGTEKNPGAAFSQDVAAIGGQENAFTDQRLYRLLPARSARAPQGDDGARSRPHHRPGAHRRRRAARAQCRARRAEHAGRQQSGRAARASRWMPRSISTIPTAGR